MLASVAAAVPAAGLGDEGAPALEDPLLAEVVPLRVDDASPEELQADTAAASNTATRTGAEPCRPMPRSSPKAHLGVANGANPVVVTTTLGARREHASPTSEGWESLQLIFFS
jgi:hypothetical protein